MQSRRKVEIGYEDATHPPVAPPATAIVSEAPSALEKAPQQEALPFRQVAVLPDDADNCAIATQTLAAGSRLQLSSGDVITLPHTVLEGHRFAFCNISPGEKLTSWSLGFGLATKPLAPGDYCCNDSIISALRERSVEADLPSEGNFDNFFEPLPDEARERDHCHAEDFVTLEAGPDGKPLGFEGFLRSGGRGVGTRNYLIILGTSGRVAAFARQVERRFVGSASGCFDGVVAVAHTEGSDERAHNRDKVLRCLCGFLVHPNVGACLVVDHPQAPNRDSMEKFIASNASSFKGLDELPVRWLSVSDDVQDNILSAMSLVEEMLPSAKAAERSWQPASAITVAQQCGGSDAFSGVAGNPASGGAVKRLIAAGGKALLAETDELIGAEAYILSRTKSREVEEQFLRLVKRYRDYTSRHGHSAEGNPSGGNKFRGLYNIALKSVGAAMKKPRECRLEGCVEYGQRLVEDNGGYFFMDSPGNDPESIAGQVACGCNVVHFITGNGSITNFPFVPTIKIITTTSRWNLLSKDMDFNAGRLQEGSSLDELADDLFQETLEVGSGKKTVGEKAGHWQVCIWRDWHLAEGASETEKAEAAHEDKLMEGPLAMKPSPDAAPDMVSRTWEAVPTNDGSKSSRSVALILPTSLCSGQVAVKIADALRPEAASLGFQSVVALPHTEGCGTSTSEMQDNIFRNVMVGHLLHPSVRRAVLLEHGCEKTHNDWFGGRLKELGHDPSKFGWASIQLDGGIEKVTDKVRDLLLGDKENGMPGKRVAANARDLRIGILADHKPSRNIGLALASVVGDIVRSGGLAVTTQHNEILSSAEFLDELLEGGPDALCPTAKFATPLAGMRGLHVMSCPPRLAFTEQVTGLAAAGADVIIAAVGAPVAGSPLVPVLQVRCVEGPRVEDRAKGIQKSFDVCLFSGDEPPTAADRLWDRVLAVVSGHEQPKLFGSVGEGSVDFVVPRGTTGVSL